MLHNEIAEEITENQEEFNKLGLIEYCRHTNKLTDNNAESIVIPDKLESQQALC